MRGRDEPLDVDRSGRREQHPVGVAEVDLTVRLNLSEDLARVLVRDVIERHRARVGLVEVDPRVLSDVKALPVDHSALAALVNVHQSTICARCLTDTRYAACNHASYGELINGRGLLGCCEGCDRCEHKRADRPDGGL